MDAVDQALETLELGPNATLQEIRQSYRDLVKVWHPDRYQGNERLTAKANEKLKEMLNLKLEQEEAQNKILVAK